MCLQLGRTSERLARATAVKGRNSKKIQYVWKASSVKRDFNVQWARKTGSREVAALRQRGMRLTNQVRPRSVEM